MIGWPIGSPASAPQSQRRRLPGDVIPSLDALLGHGVAVHSRRGRHLPEPAYVDFNPTQSGVTVYVPEEANRLRLGGTAFRLDPEVGGRSYHVRGLSAEFLRAFLDRHAADPLCHFLDWDDQAIW